MQTAYVGEGAGSFRQTMTGVFSVQDYIDASVHEKYEQTLKFIDHALKAEI